jgi:hypothetical protein
MKSILSNFIRRVAAGFEANALGPALDTITATGTAIGATLAAATVAVGDSLQVKNQVNNVPRGSCNCGSTTRSPARCASARRSFTTTSTPSDRACRSGCSTRSSRGAVRNRSSRKTCSPWKSPGSAVAGDIESIVLQVYYPDLPGQSARLMSWEQVKPKILNIVGQRIAITLGSTVGYNGGRALNADTDLLQANTDYAVLGMSTNTECAAICLRGPDTGNLRCSVPGEPGHLIHHTNYWFKRLSIAYGLPLIPIINSANKGATFVDCVNDENGGTANVVIWLAQLK